jgi:hypothetical protein
VITRGSTLTEVAFAVCTALDEAGIKAVLTGGSAATFYAPDAYQSLDLDFVITFHGGGDGAAALAALGYHEEDGTYIHRESPLPVEFPRGPLMIGDDYITRWATIERGGERLHVLSPTDSCRDRLAALLFWNDFSGLQQALAVFRAQQGEIDLALIRDWCARERQPEPFAIFEARLRYLGLLPD